MHVKKIIFECFSYGTEYWTI